MPKQQNHLFVIEDDAGRSETVLDAPSYSIGRDPKCDICLKSRFVSRRHATLIQVQNVDGSFYYRIVDGIPEGKLSCNGLLINGQKLQTHHLHHKDEVVFGPATRAFYYSISDGDSPLDSDSKYPPNPYPFTPELGAETLPDQGFSQIP